MVEIELPAERTGHLFTDEVLIKLFSQPVFGLFCCFGFFFCLFKATPGACGGSQARGPIGATAAGLHHSHSNARSEVICDLHHRSQQRRILNPPSQARD